MKFLNTLLTFFTLSFFTLSLIAYAYVLGKSEALFLYIITFVCYTLVYFTIKSSKNDEAVIYSLFLAVSVFHTTIFTAYAYSIIGQINF